jgi:pilus assembly protein CpaE
MLDVLRGAERFDARFLQGVLSERAGLRLLAPAPSLVPLDAMSPELALDIVDQAARLHDFTVVDMPGAWTDWTAPVLKRSDLIALVATATVSSVLRARRIIEALDEAHVRTPVFVVLNRLQGLVETADKAPRIERSLDLKLGARLAFDPAALRAADRGELVVDAFPSARLSRDFRTAAGALKRQLDEVRSRISIPTIAGAAA